MTFPEPKSQRAADDHPRQPSQEIPGPGASPDMGPDMGPDSGTDSGTDFPFPEQEILGAAEPGVGSRSKSGDSRNKISRWLEKRAARVMGKVYEERAEDLQARAARTIGTVYEERADELEDRAVNAMRRAIEAESDRIRIAIEHGVAVKKREVRLSLLVLAASSTIYLVLYYLTR
ncbi:MAG: hypothetical protein ACI82F_004036 [Planctomycetota bacterium]|jgi:hypothetical protein